MLRKGYSESGKGLGFLETRNQKKRSDNVYMKAVTCFVIDKATGDVLVEKRTRTGINPDEFDLVSGHVDGDEIGVQAIVRELNEEVGIPIEESVSNLKKVEEFIPMNFEIIGKYFVEFYCLLRNTKEGLVLQEDEVTEIEWKPMEEVFEMLQQGKTRFPKDFNYEKIFQKVREIYQGKSKQQQNLNR